MHPPFLRCAFDLRGMRLCYHSALISTTFFPEAMPLSADPVPRIRKHTRSVRFEAYARADGPWDIPPAARQCGCAVRAGGMQQKPAPFDAD